MICETFCKIQHWSSQGLFIHKLKTISVRNGYVKALYNIRQQLRSVNLSDELSVTVYEEIRDCDSPVYIIENIKDFIRVWLENAKRTNPLIIFVAFISCGLLYVLYEDTYDI